MSENMLLMLMLFSVFIAIAACLPTYFMTIRSTYKKYTNKYDLNKCTYRIFDSSGWLISCIFIGIVLTFLITMLMIPYPWYIPFIKIIYKAYMNGEVFDAIKCSFIWIVFFTLHTAAIVFLFASLVALAGKLAIDIIGALVYKNDDKLVIPRD